MKHLLIVICFLALLTALIVAPVDAAPLRAMDEPLLTAINEAGAAEMLPVVALMRPERDVDEIAWLVDGLNRRERKIAVWNILSTRAAKDHDALLGYLEKQMADGNAEDIRSLVLANGVSFQGTPAVIEAVAARSDVRIVIYDPETQILPELPDGGESAVDDLDEIVWGVQRINAPAVWEQGYTGEGVLVAVIDTGVNYNHTDLAAHLWDGGAQYPNHGYDFYNNDNNPMDDNSHGTHCAGTAVGDGTSGTQTGVAPEATLMCLKVLSAGGSGDYADTWSALDFALAFQADVTSISLGWTNLASQPRATFRNSFDMLNLSGVHSAVAAGNERGWTPAVPNNVRTPGTVPSPWRNPDEVEEGTRSGVITIGATQSNDAIANFSSQGPVTWSAVSPFLDYPYGGGSVGLFKPDVSAPGVSVTSLTHNNNTGYVGGATWSGTSMATPHVAGVIALMLSKYDELTTAEVDSILQTTALDLGLAGKDNDFGAGLVLADAAVDQVFGITGVIEGYVLNANDGEPLEGVEVRFLETGRYTISDEEGFYTVELQIGSYTMHVVQAPFQDFQLAELEVAEDDTLEIDVELQSGMLQITPSETDTLFFSFGDESNYLTISNGGSAGVHVSVNLSPSDEPIEWLDPIFQTDLTTVTTDNRLRGLTYANGQFYVTGSNNSVNPNMVYVLDSSGEQVNSFIQPGSDQPEASANGMYDLAYDGSNLWGSDGRDIIRFDPETGAEVSRFAGPFNPNRALAYDSDQGLLWVGESLQNIVAVDPETGEQVTVVPSNLRVQAFDYVANDPDGMQLYIAAQDQGSARAFYKMDTVSGELVRIDDLPDAEERDLIGLTWVSGYEVYYVALIGLLNGTPDDFMKGWQIDATVSWAELGFTEITLEPQEETTLEIISRTEGLPPSIYDAFLIFEHDGFGEPLSVPMQINLVTSVEQGEATVLPSSYSLAAPYPNPFNATTTLTFTTPVAGDVRLVVFDLLGREVLSVKRGALAAGRHTASLQMSDHASGIYFVRLEAGSDTHAIRKMVLLK